MAVLVTAIYAFLRDQKEWMAVTSTAMTAERLVSLLSTERFRCKVTAC